MPKIREIINLFESGIDSFRAIGRCVNSDHEVVSKIIKIAKEHNLSYLDIKDMSDEKLYEIFYPHNTNIKYQKPEVDVDKVVDELRNNKKLTLKLLWQEYKNDHPDGYGYTQFCEKIREKTNERNITMHIDRLPGEKMYVDWTGDTMNIYDSQTGEVIKIHLFVACIGISSLTYVEGFLNTKLESFIQGNIDALNYFDALPIFIVPDNDKSAVTKADKYNPIINESYLDMANYYDIKIFPARVRSPKDKGSVEKAVLDAAERNIINKFRNYKFFSIEELNARIYEEMNLYNVKPYQKEPNFNRISKYLSIDKPAMRPLPPDSYEMTIFKVATVHMDSHIEIDHKLFSAPYQYVGKEVDVKIGTKNVRIYYKNVLIATHIITNKYRITDPTHLPERNQAYLKQNKNVFISWATSISLSAFQIVENMFIELEYEVYAYRPCLGLKRLYKLYGPTRFNLACEKAILDNKKNYMHVKNLLDNGISKTSSDEVIINHTNIRGRKAYVDVGGLK